MSRHFLLLYFFFIINNSVKRAKETLHICNNRPLVKSAKQKKTIFFFLNQKINCVYSKEPSHPDGSFKHPKHMLKRMGKKIFTILR